MESETRRKIEETVAEILSEADLEETTEFKVRVAASERLGIELSHPDFRRVVRTAVEKFLLSPPESDQKLREATTNSDDRFICKLSKKRNAAVHDFRGKTLVSIRDFHLKDGKLIPTARGISLSAEQWSSFKQNVPAIEETIRKMESKLRAERSGRQTKDVPGSVTNVPREIHIEIDRFDGKNYKCWEQQMDLLLKQLRIAYVLHEPCPDAALGLDTSIKQNTQLKDAGLKWKNDDYICYRNILNTLSDNLYSLFSKKIMTAKELWEELKLIHLFEEFGTKRSQVKKYIEYQMVDERSILDQVQEINDIADSIVAGGMVLEEKFHVSVIISKLPPSWKDVHIKLMCEDHLPFRLLMNRLGAEEELRKGRLRRPNPAAVHSPDKDVWQTGHQKLPFFHPKKRELQMDNKIVCHACGKKGHIASHCRNKIWRHDNEFSEKRKRSNGPAPIESFVYGDKLVDVLDPISEERYGSFQS